MQICSNSSVFSPRPTAVAVATGLDPERGDLAPGTGTETATEIEVEVAAVVVAAEAAEVAAVTTRDVAPGTENAPADSEQLVVDPNFFHIFSRFFFLFVCFNPSKITTDQWYGP